MFTLDYITKKIYNFVNIFIIKTIIDILGDFIKKIKGEESWKKSYIRQKRE